MKKMLKHAVKKWESHMQYFKMDHKKQGVTSKLLSHMRDSLTNPEKVIL